jgi:hypothetical protein
VSARTELISRLPWVTRLEPSQQDCRSYRYSHMTLRARQDPAVMARLACRNRARWQFTALPGSSAEDGAYCWAHLLVQLRCDPREENRTRTGLAYARERSRLLSAAADAGL